MRHDEHMAVPLRYALAIGISYASGLLGYLFVRSDVLTWFETLVKPPLTPSVYLFTIVWIILYGLIGIAFGILWTHTELWHPWVGSFLIGLAFNAAWIMFFFGLHVIFISLVTMVCLTIITISLVMGAWDIERRAGYLLLPYLAAVLFALYINAGIWLLS